MNREEAISADSVACVSVLMGCTDLQAIDQGLFRTGMRHDLVSWTALLSSYAKHGYSEVALLCLVRMLKDGFKPNQFTLASALTAASRATSTQTGKVLHALVIKTGLDTNTSVGSALIDMYSKCGDIGSAISYFKGSSKCDIFSWNALLTGHAQHGNVTELLSIFEEMLNHELKPDSITFLAILNGCSHGGFVDKLLHYYNMMQDKYGIRPKVEHRTCVVDALIRANLFKEAVNFIQGTGCKAGPEILRVFISSCATAGLVQLGLAAAARMVVSGLTNNSAHVLLSNLYALDEKWIDARRIREAAQTDHTYIKEAGKSWISC
ncbi:pentatricopeptide repeat-containing protein At4g13650-like [Dioscorea cayenensis subsp. rotundata]|uniref:Pentatricopeptide repeat-containing protein At4g13650-like n=1 Tax=Dioscorea cayennensis subsp. rotundata TaxID=55577 RepID=A0AB40BSE0_DIOCR|nr:pentatricopeptide repeat-containing protein At4g13650-like [Dioscorea cayenensis subsp. rotundata]